MEDEEADRRTSCPPHYLTIEGREEKDGRGVCIVACAYDFITGVHCSCGVLLLIVQHVAFCQD